MKAKYLNSLAALVLMTPLLRADTTVATPVPGTLMTTPMPNATGMAEKEYGAVIKAALQPLRDKLATDRQALKDAKTSADADKIAAAKALVRSDLDAILDKRVSMEHERRAIGQAAKEGRDKSDDKKEKRSLKSETHREKADGMKDKGQEHRY